MEADVEIYRKEIRYADQRENVVYRTNSVCLKSHLSFYLIITIIIIIIIIIINCNWVVTRWQWLFYMYTNMKKSN